MKFTDKLRWVPGALMFVGFLSIVAGISTFGTLHYDDAWVFTFAGIIVALILFALALVSQAAIRYLDRAQDDSNPTNS